MMSLFMARGSGLVARVSWLGTRGLVARGSWLVAWLVARRSGLVARGSWLVARGSRFVARGSWLAVRGSWLAARGSWLVVPKNVQIFPTYDINWFRKLVHWNSV